MNRKGRNIDWHAVWHFEVAERLQRISFTANALTIENGQNRVNSESLVYNLMKIWHFLCVHYRIVSDLAVSSYQHVFDFTSQTILNFFVLTDLIKCE